MTTGSATCTIRCLRNEKDAQSQRMTAGDATSTNALPAGRERRAVITCGDKMCDMRDAPPIKKKDAQPQHVTTEGATRTMRRP